MPTIRLEMRDATTVYAEVSRPLSEVLEAHYADPEKLVPAIIDGRPEMLDLRLVATAYTA